MEFLDRDGVRIAYEVHNRAGSGIPLLLSHGFSATSAMWRHNVNALSADRMVVTWDQRGHGDSDAPSDPGRYSHEHCLADMAALLDVVGARRAVIGGMSLGGYLSLSFHLAYPARVAALVLVDTGPGFRRDEPREEWNGWAVQRADAIDRDGTLGSASTEVLEAHHRDIRGVAQAARRVLVQADNSVITSLSAIAVPTLIVVGAQDTGFLAAADYMERSIPGSHKVVIADAGHAANLDQPAVFNDAVTAFLRTDVER